MTEETAVRIAVALEALAAAVQSITADVTEDDTGKFVVQTQDGFMEIERR